jgi:membrane protease YdiL (CAAX protease family)
MSYWQATRHPGPCLLFLAPLLAAYEIGVVKLGGVTPLALRNGADAWLRWGLETFGVQARHAAPALIVAVLGVWWYRKRDTTPDDLPGLCLGMALESIVAALGLWGLSRTYGPTLDYWGITLATPASSAAPESAYGLVVTYVGAGVYEETIFRLILFTALCQVFGAVAPAKSGVLLAAVSGAVLFAVAHHVGPHGEAADGFNFVFRVVAGLVFTAVYALRGFGVAVGCHACYDVLVGVAM